MGHTHTVRLLGTPQKHDKPQGSEEAPVYEFFSYSQRHLGQPCGQEAMPLHRGSLKRVAGTVWQLQRTAAWGSERRPPTLVDVGTVQDGEGGHGGGGCGGPGARSVPRQRRPSIRRQQPPQFHQRRLHTPPPPGISRIRCVQDYLVESPALAPYNQGRVMETSFYVRTSDHVNHCMHSHRELVGG